MIRMFKVSIKRAYIKYNVDNKPKVLKIVRNDVSKYKRKKFRRTIYFLMYDALTNMNININIENNY